MTKSPRPLIRLLILASTAAIAVGAAACSWNLGYLESGGDGSASSDVQPSDASVAHADAGAGDASTNPTPDTSSPPVESGSYFGDGGNLIQNPSCEDGITDWSTLGQTPLESSTAFVHSGDTTSCHSYDRVHEEMTGALSSYDGPMQDITSVVVPGHQYTVSAWTLWAPPSSPDGGVAGETDAGDDASPAGSSDGGASGMSDASADATPDAAGGYEQQDTYITVKETCGSSVTYVRLASAVNLVEATWTQVTGATTLLTVPTGCMPLDLELYVEGPDVGLDLYVDEVTLLFAN